MNSASRWLTATGSRASGPCPDPSISTRVPPVSSASRRPTSGGLIRSSVPCTTTTGQRTLAHSSAASAVTAPSRPMVAAVVSTSTCGVVSRAHPMQSSICWVECGSGNIWPKKNAKKSSAPPSTQWCRLYFSQPCGSRTGWAQPSRSRCGAPAAKPGEEPMRNSPRTRSGWSAASPSDHAAPRDRATSTACPVPVASITARVSATHRSWP